MDIAISRGETVYIPQEIVDYIIDCVPRDAKRILSTCAAITRSWVPRARLHLFREVHINPHYCTGTHPGFCRFLEENPDVAAFIHTLTLRGLTYEIEDESIVAMTPYYMSIIVSRLRNLESLMISNMTWNTTVRTGLSGKPLQNWPPTNPLKLDTLHISSCLVSKGTSAGLLEMLEGFSYVRDLHFEQIQLREKRIAPSKTSLPQPIKALATEHLTLDCEASTGQRKFNEAILSTRCGKTVRHLTLVLHGLKEASVAKAALRIVKNKLQHFDLDIVDYEGLNDQTPEQLMTAVHFSYCQSITTFTIRIPLNNPNFDPDIHQFRSGWPYLLPAVKLLPDHLEHLRVVIVLKLDPRRQLGRYRRLFKYLDSFTWPLFEDELSRFTNLKTITFRLEDGSATYFLNAYLYEKFRKVIVSKLPSYGGPDYFHWEATHNYREYIIHRDQNLGEDD